MKAHEFADIFPLMDKKEFSDLKKDIKENGLMEPIITLNNLILDGRNRYTACEEVGVKPTLKEFDGEDPLQYVMSTNLQRRNLNQSQKAMVGRRWKVHYSKYAKERMAQSSVEPVPQVEQARARDKAGEVAGVSGRYIDMAEEVIAKKPELEEKIMSGERKIKEVLREIKIEEQKAEIKKENFEKPEGDYDVIIIDPPWHYNDDKVYDVEGFRGTCPYPTMSIEQIKNIKIPAKDNCVVWLWTTNKHIFDCREILTEWGFEIKSILTWDKVNIGIGRWLRSQTEHCILAIKGKPYFNNKTQATIFSEKRTSHSTKPESFYNIVEKICSGRKLDYFARKKREGWDVYGDEV